MFARKSLRSSGRRAPDNGRANDRLSIRVAHARLLSPQTRVFRSRLFFKSRDTARLKDLGQSFACRTDTLMRCNTAPSAV
ncbi:hypothetical protein EVAR_52076_1 [Eumeta japonica]|uniref:Uncharacterized protein n=1 Tax=Eumeta variegata TaxID=151549 RepID=A0A4C1Y4W4_EUMVA|nr:hypothetical protein EVAR_52076_1 [Eumeta japonica]